MANCSCATGRVRVSTALLSVHGIPMDAASHHPVLEGVLHDLCVSSLNAANSPRRVQP